MRFILATTVLSLAAMIIAVPTEGLVARGGGETCAQGLTTQCCSTSTSGGNGILGNFLDLGCTDLVADIPIIGAVLGGSNKCNGQIACCNLSPSPVPAPDCDDNSNSAGTQGGVSIPILSNDCIEPNIIL